MNQPRIRPEWADRLRQERGARDWTQEDVVRAMRALAEHPLPEDLLTTYKRYERGKHYPTTYASLLAAVFGTDTTSLFGRRRPARQAPASTTPPCRCGVGPAVPVALLDAPADQWSGSVAGCIQIYRTMNHQRVLVTGGSGVIAEQCILILQVLDQDHQVHTVVRSLTRDDALSFIAADLTSDTGCADSIDSFDVMLHVASPAHPEHVVNETT